MNHNDYNKAEQYQKCIVSLVEQLRVRSEPIYIFGAGRAGWYVMKVLDYFHIPITGFLDNKTTQKTFENYPVFAPQEVGKEKTVILGIFRPESVQIVMNQLISLGTKHIEYEMAAFLFIFFRNVVKRECDMTILANSIAVLFENYKEKPDNYGYTQKGYFVSPFVTSNITQKCSLDCQDCGQLIPYYKSPVNFSADTIVRDILQYSKAFDVIPEMSLHGGEPLMNKQIASICREVAKIPNIVFISFLTNGTIKPSDEVMNALATSGAALQQSDYRELSPKQATIFQLCSKYGVYSDIVYTTASGNWNRMPETKQHFRTEAHNNEIFNECVSSKICCQIMDGELHRCPHSMHATKIELIPKLEGDYVQLVRDEDDDEALVQEVRALLTRKHALNACDHCDPRNSVEVRPAIQLIKRRAKMNDHQDIH